MNTSTVTRSIFLASLLCASSAFAGDIRKCVASDGQVTLTDEECPGGTRLHKVISATTDAEPALAASQAPRQEAADRYTLNRMPVRYVHPARTSNPVRGMSLDGETLRAARVNMLALRNQRMASLQ